MAADFLMSDPVQLELFPQKQTGAYCAYYTHEWSIETTGLPLTVKDWLDDNCEGLWGWRFKDDTLTISFEDEQDLVQAKLCLTISNNKY